MALRSKEVTLSQIRSVRFGFYTDDEVGGAEHTASKRDGWMQGELGMHNTVAVDGVASSCLRWGVCACPGHAAGTPPLTPGRRMPVRGCGCAVARTQVRKLSVIRVVSPVMFDNLKQPLPQSLYDASMGPIDPNGR